MNKVRWGVVGTGGIARKVMSDLMLLPDATLVGVCSRTTDSAATFAAQWDPALRPVTEVADLFPEIDVLYVATPHLQHPDATLAALRAGIPVLCEKPLAARQADAEQMVATAREHGTFLMEAVWTRFNPLHVRLRELIADGTLGELRRVVADFSFRNEYDPAGRLWDPARGGGTLLDMGVYPVNLVQSLLGTPDSIAVHGSLTGGVDDSATLLLRYPNGVSGVATCTLTADGPNTASILGTKARVDIDAKSFCPESMTLTLGDGPGEILTTEIRGSGYVPMLEHVNEQVRAGATESPVVPLDDTLAVFGILTSALDTLGVTYP